MQEEPYLTTNMRSYGTDPIEAESAGTGENSYSHPSGMPASPVCTKVEYSTPAFSRHDTVIKDSAVIEKTIHPLRRRAGRERMDTIFEKIQFIAVFRMLIGRIIDQFS